MLDKSKMLLHAKADELRDIFNKSDAKWDMCEALQDELDELSSEDAFGEWQFLDPRLKMAKGAYTDYELDEFGEETLIHRGMVAYEDICEVHPREFVEVLACAKSHNYSVELNTAMAEAFDRICNL